MSSSDDSYYEDDKWIRSNTVKSTNMPADVKISYSDDKLDQDLNIHFASDALIENEASVENFIGCEMENGPLACYYCKWHASLESLMVSHIRRNHSHKKQIMWTDETTKKTCKFNPRASFLNFKKKHTSPGFTPERECSGENSSTKHLMESTFPLMKKNAATLDTHQNGSNNILNFDELFETEHQKGEVSGRCQYWTDQEKSRLWHHFGHFIRLQTHSLRPTLQAIRDVQQNDPLLSGRTAAAIKRYLYSSIYNTKQSKKTYYRSKFDKKEELKIVFYKRKRGRSKLESYYTETADHIPSNDSEFPSPVTTPILKAMPNQETTPSNETTPTRYCCLSCSYKTLSQFHFRLHLAQHATDRAHLTPVTPDSAHPRCGICGYLSDGDRDFESHVDRHVSEKAYLCGVCLVDFWTRAEVAEHSRKTHAHMELCVVDRGQMYLRQSHEQQVTLSLQPVVKLTRVNVKPDSCVKVRTRTPPDTNSYHEDTLEKGVSIESSYLTQEGLCIDDMSNEKRNRSVVRDESMSEDDLISVGDNANELGDSTSSDLEIASREMYHAEDVGVVIENMLSNHETETTETMPNEGVYTTHVPACPTAPPPACVPLPPVTKNAIATDNSHSDSYAIIVDDTYASGQHSGIANKNILSIPRSTNPWGVFNMRESFEPKPSEEQSLSKTTKTKLQPCPKTKDLFSKGPGFDLFSKAGSFVISKEIIKECIAGIKKRKVCSEPFVHGQDAVMVISDDEPETQDGGGNNNIGDNLASYLLGNRKDLGVTETIGDVTVSEPNGGIVDDKFEELSSDKHQHSHDSCEIVDDDLEYDYPGDDIVDNIIHRTRSDLEEGLKNDLYGIHVNKLDSNSERTFSFKAHAKNLMESNACETLISEIAAEQKDVMAEEPEQVLKNYCSPQVDVYPKEPPMNNYQTPDETSLINKSKYLYGVEPVYKKTAYELISTGHSSREWHTRDLNLITTIPMISGNSLIKVAVSKQTFEASAIEKHVSNRFKQCELTKSNNSNCHVSSCSSPTTNRYDKPKVDNVGDCRTTILNIENSHVDNYNIVYPASECMNIAFAHLETMQRETMRLPNIATKRDNTEDNTKNKTHTYSSQFAKIAPKPAKHDDNINSKVHYVSTLNFAKMGNALAKVLKTRGGDILKNDKIV